MPETQGDEKVILVVKQGVKRKCEDDPDSAEERRNELYRISPAPAAPPKPKEKLEMLFEAQDADLKVWLRPSPTEPATAKIRVLAPIMANASPRWRNAMTHIQPGKRFNITTDNKDMLVKMVKILHCADGGFRL